MSRGRLFHDSRPLASTLAEGSHAACPLRPLAQSLSDRRWQDWAVSVASFALVCTSVPSDEMISPCLTFQTTNALWRRFCLLRRPTQNALSPRYRRCVAPAKKSKPSPRTDVKTRPSPLDAHDIVFFRRNVRDDPDERSPGHEALNSFPIGVQAKFYAVLEAVATAPPSRFSGGGYWEAMRGTMSGWFEVRIDGPNREHFRLYCLLDYAAISEGPGSPLDHKPCLVIVDGRRKPFRTELSTAEYAAIRQLGEEFLRQNPRSVL